MKLKKRDLQIWKPLLAIAELINHELFLEINLFAERISLQRREDFISEDSWDYRILKIVLEILESGEVIIRPKEIREKYKQEYLEESEKSPHEKTIIKILDQVGFKELKKPRDHQGNYYLITKENFSIIVNPICPILSTLHTLPTLPLYNKEKSNVAKLENNVGNVGKVKDVKKGNVANVEIVGNVAKLEMKGNGKDDEKVEVVKVPSSPDSKQEKKEEKS